MYSLRVRLLKTAFASRHQEREPVLPVTPTDFVPDSTFAHFDYISEIESSLIPHQTIMKGQCPAFVFGYPKKEELLANRVSRILYRKNILGAVPICG
jgi:hypothetical protein